MNHCSQNIWCEELHCIEKDVEIYWYGRNRKIGIDEWVFHFHLYYLRFSAYILNSYKWLFITVAILINHYVTSYMSKNKIIYFSYY